MVAFSFTDEKMGDMGLDDPAAPWIE